MYSFVTKVIELEKFKSATKMLSQVRVSDNDDYDIKITTKKKNVTIEISEKLRTNITKNVNVDNFSFKGEERFAIYFTSYNDPHFLYDSIEISLKDLFKVDQLKFTVDI